MGIGKVNFLNSNDPRYNEGFRDGFQSRVYEVKKVRLESGDIEQGYRLINRIRKLTKDANLPKHVLDERMASIFNDTQDILMKKGLL